MVSQHQVFFVSNECYKAKLTWLLVNIGSGYDNNKPSSEPMLIKYYVAIWRN